MMSSSELQRISLSATKNIRTEGIIKADPLFESTTNEEDDDDEEDDDRKSETKSLTIGNRDEQIKLSENLTNGIDGSPSKANITITSSIGDITVDSVRDHLNSTVTTLHTTTTEEIVGKLKIFLVLLTLFYESVIYFIFDIFSRSFICIEHTNQ